MQLDGPQLRQLQQALIDAYPTRSALEQMVFHGLSVHLDEITAQGGLGQAVFELLRWAQAQGRCKELIKAALNHNHQNPQLLGVAEQLEVHNDQPSPSGTSDPRSLKQESGGSVVTRQLSATSPVKDPIPLELDPLILIQQRKRERWPRPKNRLILVVSSILLLTVGLAIASQLLIHGGNRVLGTPTVLGTQIPTQMPAISLPDGIGVTPAPNGETIGISDGRYIFDTAPSSADLKKKAAKELQNGREDRALPLLRQAHEKEPNDAEALIYRENISLRWSPSWLWLLK